METEFRSYRIRMPLEEAGEMARILEEAGITSFIEENKKLSLEDTKESYESSFDLQLKQEDFVKADQLMLERAYRMAEEAEESFLIALSDDELMDVVYKYDEWGEANHAIARRLLKKHGKSLSDEYILSLRKKRWNELHKTVRANLALIVIGYLSVILPGILAMGIGWYLYYATEVGRDGKQFRKYDSASRINGIIIAFLGFLSLLIYIMLGVFK